MGFRGLCSHLYHLRLDVRLPKFVRIENTRLKLLQMILQVAVVVALGVMYVMNKGYMEIAIPQGYPTNWAEPPDALHYDSAVQADLQKEFCQQPSALNYKFSDYFTYSKFQCLIMSTNELFIKVGKNIIYFPTYFHEEWEETAADSPSAPHECSTLIANVPACSLGEWLGDECYVVDPCPSGSGCSRMCLKRRRKHFFTVGIESMTMAFSHFYQVVHPTLGTSSGSSAISVVCGVEYTVHPILTIIYDSDEKEFDCGRPAEGYCRFEPGASVALTVGQWLDVSGVSLVTENKLVRGNQWATGEGGAKYEYPMHRITGGEILISTKYEDHSYHRVKHDSNCNVNSETRWTFETSWPYTVCKVVVQGMSTWTGMPTNRYEKLADAGDDNSGYKMRQRYYEGVRFVFTSSVASKFGFASIMEVSNFFVQLVVYLGVVATGITYLAIYGLGATSKTYYRAQQEPIRVREECSQGLPARLLQSATSFYMLSALEQMGEKGTTMATSSMKHGFNYKTLRSVFQHVMIAYKDIDEKELELMTRTVFNALSMDGERVRLADFCEATSMSECFDVHSMVLAFDSDRKKSCLERLFNDGAGVTTKRSSNSSKVGVSP